ncbi:MAG: cysteine desulfurase [Bacilli bacterium]|nr:cysteine desulfurase [Bacilli bacterium]
MSSKNIYFDNASTTFIDESILESFNKAVKTYPGNPSSIHKYGQESSRIIEKSRDLILSSLCLNNHEVIFTSGATEANNLAIKGFALAHKTRGKHIIVSEVEHPSILETVRELERDFGYRVSYLHINAEGKVSLEELESLIEDDTFLVSIMAVNNEIGSVNNIEDIAKYLKQFPKIAFHVDAVQALGKIDINYKDVDMITITGHKIHGLVGSGCLIKRKGITIEAIINGGGQENNIRSGTYSLPLISTLALAISKAIKNQKTSFNLVKVVSDKLLDELTKMDDLLVINSNTKENPFVVNFSLKKHKASVVVEALSNRNIFVSSISACHSKGEPVSYVVKALKHDDVLAHNTIRVSLDTLNTVEEVKIFIKEFKEIIGGLKQ